MRFPLLDVITKTCTKCNQEKSIDEFVRDSTRPDGRYPHCKSCRRDYYLQNADQIRASTHAYRQNNLTRISEWNKKYNTGRFFWKTSRNLRSRGEPPFATMKELAALWKFQRGICPLTNRRLNRETAQLDHIIPVVKGGDNTLSNLRWVHRDVNYAKRDLSDADFFSLCMDVASCKLLKGR